METYQVGLIALGVFGLMGLVAFASWRRKIRAQQQLLEAPQFVEFDGSDANALYVATTFRNRRLDRVLAHGLAHRGWASLVVLADRLEVHRVGETSFSIPAHSIIELTESTAVIDRAVEQGGLSSIAWKLGDEVLESHFRFTNASIRNEVESGIKNLGGAIS